MATWSIRQAGGEQNGLTIYQLQELIRSGRVTAEDQVTQDGQWRAIGDLPSLARLLPVDEAPEQRAAPGDSIVVHGVKLQVGADGKPLPPPPDVVAKLLAAEVGPRRFDKAAAQRLTFIAASVMIGALALLALIIVVHERHAR